MINLFFLTLKKIEIWRISIRNLCYFWERKKWTATNDDLVKVMNDEPVIQTFYSSCELTIGSSNDRKFSRMVASTKWKLSHVFAQLQPSVRGLKKLQGVYKCNQSCFENG
jgi:hypothetical protein